MKTFFFQIILSQLLLLCSVLAEITDPSQDKLIFLSECLSDPNFIYIQRNNSPESLYTQINRQWNTKTQVNPIAILLPTSTSHVQSAIRCGRRLNIRMVPKGGGHSFDKFSSGDNESVIVDLRKMSEISVNVKEATARVGAGTLLGPLYWTLWEKGRFGLPAASCVNPGISGVTLGGGQGIWSRRYGLTLDRVLEMEFVDAKGDFLTVNQKNYSDLFWALRGAGGGSFGIVVNFKFKLFDASKHRVHYIRFTYTNDMFEEVFEAWQRWNFAAKDKGSYTRFGSAGTGFYVMIVDVDLSPEDIAEIRQSFPPANASPISFEVMNYIELQGRERSIWNPRDLNTISRENQSFSDYWAKSFLMGRRLLSSSEIAQLSSVFRSIPTGIFFSFEGWGGVMNQVGRNETAFVHRDALFNAYCGKRRNDTIGNDWWRRFGELGSIFDGSALHGETYQNFVDSDLDDYLERYYGENLEKLKMVKKMYDPDNFFRFKQSIPLP